VSRVFFDTHLVPGDIFVDVGAHIGTYSIAAATLHPGEVKVLALEAHPLNAMTLMRQLALNGLQLDVELVCAAAGAKAGFSKLWPYSTMGNFVSAERPHDAPDDNPPLRVPVIPVDMLFAERDDLVEGRIFMKVDVEGYEPEVLAGADGLLASGRVAAVVFEKSDFYAEASRWRAFEGMIEQLERYGYTIRWFPQIHLPCALIPWVPGNEAGNLVALAPGFNALTSYDAPYAPCPSRPPPMREDGSDADKAAFTARLMESRASDGWRWADPHNMEEDATVRAKLASPHIPARLRILDLVAGLMAMALRLKVGSQYTPVDIIRYAAATVLVDLNDDQFPEGKWDFALALELLEYIHDVPKLLARLAELALHSWLVLSCVGGPVMSVPAAKACFAAIAFAMFVASSAVALAGPSCTCRFKGESYAIDSCVCLSTSEGPRLACYGFVLNNTSWNFTKKLCPVAEGSPSMTNQSLAAWSEKAPSDDILSVRYATSGAVC